MSAKAKVSEDLSPLELLRQENELLRKTINSADKDIEELEAQLQVIAISDCEILGVGRLLLCLTWLMSTSWAAKPCI